MMTIKLVGALPRELKDAGLRSGDKLKAEPSEKGTYGAVKITIWKDEAEYILTVYQENYIKIGVS
jgi:putative lipoic acid-binding regulatory protein